MVETINKLYRFCPQTWSEIRKVSSNILPSQYSCKLPYLLSDFPASCVVLMQLVLLFFGSRPKDPEVRQPEERHLQKWRRMWHSTRTSSWRSMRITSRSSPTTPRFSGPSESISAKSVEFLSLRMKNWASQRLTEKAGEWHWTMFGGLWTWGGNSFSEDPSTWVSSSS